MKRILSLVLIVVFLLGLGGCKSKKQGKAIKISDLPENTFSSTFVYSLDESDWYTSVTIKDDATFVGEYFTEKSENTGSDFPNGTVYYSHFSGKFTNIRKINDYTYSLTLEEVDVEDYIGKETIKDGKKLKSTYPYGIHNGKRFLLYTPDTPVSELSNVVLAWWPKLKEHHKNPYKTISCYALVNEETNEAFFVRK